MFGVGGVLTAAKSLRNALLCNVLAYMSDRLLTGGITVAVLDELYLDDAVDIVEEMPANVVKRILRHADPDVRKSINEILKYPDDCAGSIMTTEYVDLKATMTVEDSLKRSRRTGPDKETINI